jgi:hypothetical protein
MPPIGHVLGGGSWRADVLPADAGSDLSNVVVGTTQLAFTTAVKALASASDDTQRSAPARSPRLLGAVASGVVVGPVQRGAWAPFESRWSAPRSRCRAPCGRGALAALHRRVRQRRSLAGAVAGSRSSARRAAHGVRRGDRGRVQGRASRPVGRPAFERGFEVGPALDLAPAVRLRPVAGPTRRPAVGAFEWFGVLSPMLVAPSGLGAGPAAPHARRFTTSPSLTERSVSELPTLHRARVIDRALHLLDVREPGARSHRGVRDALVIFIARLGLMVHGSRPSAPRPGTRSRPSVG